MCSLVDRRGVVVAEDAEHVRPTTAAPTTQAAAAAATSETYTVKAFANSTVTETNHSVEPQVISTDNVSSVSAVEH